MKLKLRHLIPLAVLLALALNACNEKIDDEDLSDNLVSIVSFDPLLGDSDITDVTAVGNAHRSDVVTVNVRGDARSAAALGFATDVILQSYTVQYDALDGVLDTEVPPDWAASINQLVPAGSSQTFTIQVVRAQDKTTGGAISDLDCTDVVGAACGSVRRAAVTITFSGEDIGGQPVTVSGGLTVSFGDFVDTTSAEQGLFIEGTFAQPSGGI